MYNEYINFYSTIYSKLSNCQDQWPHNTHCSTNQCPFSSILTSPGAALTFFSPQGVTSLFDSFELCLMPGVWRWMNSDNSITHISWRNDFLKVSSRSLCLKCYLSEYRLQERTWFLTYGLFVLANFERHLKASPGGSFLFVLPFI